MRHRSSEELFAYWDERRGRRLAPGRYDIEPGAIRRALGDCFMLSQTDHGPAFRLAGTRTCALFCRELKDTHFAELFDKATTSLAKQLAGIVADDTCGVIAGLTGHADDQPPLDLEMLLLPLVHHGASAARIIGVLAPLTPPYWLGLQPVRSLELGGYRYIGPTIAASAIPSLVAAPPGGKLNKGFVIYDGGRTADAS